MGVAVGGGGVKREDEAVVRRLLCFFGWHAPGNWQYEQGEIPATTCCACNAVLYKDVTGGYFE